MRTLWGSKDRRRAHARGEKKRRRPEAWHASHTNNELNTEEEKRQGLTNAVKGVNSDGFMTIVHPQARAGATFQALRVL